jgi:hypothetical protein
MPEKATVTILDRDWPGRPLPVMPGDLSQFVPNGSGLERDADPMHGAPLGESSGGTVYFDASIRPDDLATLLRVMHVPDHVKHFVVFAGSARKPFEERYLDQVRIISMPALIRLFWVDEAATLAAQPISIAEYVARFVAEQRCKWEDRDGHPFPRRLDGVFGGDGDSDKEALCFGFMVENAACAVYRVWSRAWLVNK